MIEVLSGKACIVESLGVGVSGQSSVVRSNIKFEIDAHDFKKLYDVYNVSYDQPIKIWIDEYNKDKIKLESFFEKEKLETASIRLKYELRSINNDGIDSLFPSSIYCDVLRLKMEKDYKDFLILNTPSIAAVNNGQQRKGFKALSVEKSSEF
jgi:hypothetical protein